MVKVGLFKGVLEKVMVGVMVMVKEVLEEGVEVVEGCKQTRL